MSGISIIPYKDFNDIYQYKQIWKLVGEGSYGRIFLAKDNMVVKMGEVSSLLTELNILAQLTHPNIIKPVLATYSSEKDMYYSMSLGKSIDINKMSDEDIRIYAYNMLSALKLLHSSGFVHYDIKQNNTLLFDGVAKLIDFGLATTCRLQEGKYLCDGSGITASYRPPNHLLFPNYLYLNRQDDDIFSLGKTLECLIHKKDVIYNNLPLYDSNEARFELIYKMLSDNRPPASELLKLKYFEGINLDNTGMKFIPQIPSKNQLKRVSENAFYILMDKMFDYASKNNILLENFFILIHNIHRSMYMLDSLEVEEGRFWILSHLAIIELKNKEKTFKKIVNVVFPSLNGRLNIFFDLVNHLQCVLYPETLWDRASNLNDVSKYLQQIIKYNYINYELPITEEKCNIHLPVSYILDKWKPIMKTKSLKEISEMELNFDFDCLNLTNIIAIEKITKVYNSIRDKAMKLKSKKDILEYFSDTDFILPILYNNKEIFKNDKEFYNKLIDGIKGDIILESIYDSLLK